MVRRLIFSSLSGVALIAGLLIISGPRRSAEASNDGASSGRLEPRQLDETQLEWGREMSLSVEDTTAAFSDTAEILSFQDTHAGDERFGAVWASYDGGYQVHVRSLDQSFDAEIGAFEERLGHAVKRESGGASYKAMIAARAAVEAAGVPVSVTFNSQAGTVDIDETWVGDVPGVDPSIIRRVPPPEAPSRRTAQAGDDVSAGGQATCTGGGFIEYAPPFGDLVRQFVTAAHCPDSGLTIGSTVSGPYDSGSQSGPIAAEYCATYDIEFIPVDVNSGTLYARDKPFGYGTWSFSGGVAGGWYTGQPSRKLGLWANGPSGSNAGTISNWYSNAAFPGGGDCPTGPIQGAIYNNMGAYGDSGGPMFLSYDNEWYWAGTTIAGTSPDNNIANWGQSVINNLVAPYYGYLCYSVIMAC